ncbi:MAG: phosphoglucosamine mutase [Planctomycetota bacterium]|nr:phosphoglucosamine mutase [Planctomycetota bacterium]
MAEPIISVSGLRGVLGSELTPEVAIRFANAFCSQLGPGAVLLSRDGRTSGPFLCDAIASAIVGSGRDCLDLDVAATPSVGVAVQTLRAAGAIQVSASHNPPAYNGMKLFGPDGRVVPSEFGNGVLAAYRQYQHDPQKASWAPIQSIGVRCKIDDPHQAHLDRVLATVDSQAIRRCGMKVLVDSNHGAGSILASRLLNALGCEFVILGDLPDGKFSHPPEPILENLSAVGASVTQGGFAVGFCQDPDADRLAVLDEHGAYIGEEYTPVLCIMRAMMQHRGPLVTNCASSSMTEDLAKKHQVPFFRSKVGEANVVDCMLEHKALYGGEGSGGPIDPRVVLVRDSIAAMAQILDLMAATGRSISQLVGELPAYAMIKDKMTLSKEKLDASIDLLRSKLQADSVSTLDGVRLDWADRWLLLRASNTEPLVRLIAEAPDRQGAEELIRRAKSLMQNG